MVNYVIDVGLDESVSFLHGMYVLKHTVNIHSIIYMHVDKWIIANCT